MRPLIQYDLDEPSTAPTPSLAPLAPPSRYARPPPTKKRKRGHHHPHKSQFVPTRGAPLQHWDDPGNAAVGMVYDEQEESTSIPAPFAAESDMVSYADDVEEEWEEYGEEHAVEGDDAIGVEEEEEEESRALTHQEIWDDAALIDAWNSAQAEYEAYHGASKDWKTESVKKSPLWYNKPYTAPTPQSGPSKPKAPSKPPQAQAQAQEDGEPEPDTVPLNFHTFVPTHDPSLAVPSNTGATTTPFFVPPPSTTMVSRDEAFNNALSAMYWSGYWTAVYHSQSSGQDNNVTPGVTGENEIETDDDEEDLVPAQR